MFATVSRIQVTASRTGGDHFALRFTRFTAAFSMDMKTVNARLKSLQVRRKLQTILGLVNLNGAQRFANPFSGNLMDRNLLAGSLC